MSNKFAVARAYFAARRPRVLNRPIPDVPICDEAEMASNFAKYNALGLSLDEARRLARKELETGAQPHTGYSFGLSTGTTGEPGVFLTTQRERDRWLGTILGKFLSPIQLLHLNAALLLKHNNRLYDTSDRVHYFDISKSAAHWAPRLCGLRPNVLIGPPSVLLTLADSAAFQLHPFHPHTLLSAGEALFPQDSVRLTKAFGVRPQNLYQAKEGFLAAGCRHGALHWNEDLMALEFMRFKGRPERAVPVITDFTRQSQTFRRYRIDDVLVMGTECPCQTPFQKVAAVEGRLRDILLRPGVDGSHQPLFPFDLNELLSPLGDYALIQHSPDHFTLECCSTPGHSLLQCLHEALLKPVRLDLVPWRPEPPGQKRRRFQRLFDLQNRIIVEELLEQPK
jgi:putative adenylate-forming enzyme